MFFTSILVSPFAAFGQAPKSSQVAAKAKPKAKCSGGWTGVVTLNRVQRQTDRKETPRVSMRGMDVRDYEMKGDYEAQVVVSEDPFEEGKTISRASVVSSLSFRDTTEAIEKNSCDRGKTWKDMKGSFETKTVTFGSLAGVRANVTVGVGSDGHYGVQVGVDSIPGTTSGERKATYSGQCTPKENKTDTIPESATTINGNSLTSDGKHRVDPKSPDQLSGTYSIELPGDVVETITWNLRRCGGDFMITDLKLYQPQFPTPNAWSDIKPNGHTIDGNLVRIVATVINTAGYSKQGQINFKELKEGSDSLPGGKNIQLSLKGGEEIEVPVTWDTSGYAWKPGSVWSSPEIHRQIEVKIENEVKTRDIMVKPKPVVVVPGLWSKPDLVYKFVGAFKSIPTTEWTTDLARIGISKKAAENVPEVASTVEKIQKSENAWHVDMVAHSTGGLIARSYIHDTMERAFDGKPTVTQLVMVGTPNMGTPCSTGMENIFTKIFSRNYPSYNEASIKSMKLFNERVKARKGTKFSALVGNAFDPNCQMDGPGDGIVPNRSAIWKIKQWKFSTVPARHENQLGQDPNFQQIVNWLAIPPKGDHMPDTESFMGEAEPKDELQQRRYGAMAPNLGVLEYAFESKEDSEPDVATGIKLAPEKSGDVELAIKKGSRLSVTYLAPPNVSATLYDARGNVAGKVVAGSPEAEGQFRTITIRTPFEAGTWMLRLENGEKTEAEIAVVAFVDYSSTIFKEN